MVACKLIREFIRLKNPAITFGGLSGETRDRKREKEDCNSTGEMSTTEALRTLVDKLQHEVNELQAENVKLKANQTGEESSNESELEELRQRLHQVEERELNAGQRIAELEEQYATATADNLREELEGRVGESQELRKQLDEYVNKISTLTEMSDLACYRAVDRERQKWEARENQLLELLRNRARSDEVPRVELTSALVNSSTVVDTPIPVSLWIEWLSCPQALVRVTLLRTSRRISRAVRTN